MIALLLLDAPGATEIFFIFFALGIIFFYLWVGWRLYVKAGRKGWESLIPIYSLFVQLKFVGKPWWWFFLLCIPGLNLIWAIWMTNMLSKSFGKDEGFTVGLVLLGWLFLPILALGDAEYQGPYGNKAEYDAYRARFTFEFEQKEQLQD